MQKCIRAFVMEAKAGKIQRVHFKLDHEPINYGFPIMLLSNVPKFCLAICSNYASYKSTLISVFLLYFNSFISSFYNLSLVGNILNKRGYYFW